MTAASPSTRKRLSLLQLAEELAKPATWWANTGAPSMRSSAPSKSEACHPRRASASFYVQVIDNVSRSFAFAEVYASKMPTTAATWCTIACCPSSTSSGSPFVPS